MEARQMTSKHWLLVVGILVGAVGVVLVSSAIGGVAGEDGPHNQTELEQDRWVHQSGDRPAHADVDGHRHDDGAGGSHHHAAADDHGPHHPADGTPAQPGPCHP